MLSVNSRSFVPMRHSPFSGEMRVSNVLKHALVLLHLRKMCVVSHSLAPHARHLLIGCVKMLAPARRLPKEIAFCEVQLQLVEQVVAVRRQPVLGVKL